MGRSVHYRRITCSVLILLIIIGSCLGAIGDLRLSQDGNKIIWPDLVSGITIDVSRSSIIVGDLDLIGIRSGSTIMGFSAGKDASAVGQTVFGIRAGLAGIGTPQVAMGEDAGRFNTASRQVAMGTEAGLQNTGLSQVAIGNRCGWYNDGDFNTAIGFESFNGSTTVFDTSRSRLIDEVFPASNEVTTDISHGFGSAGEYINLVWTTDGTPPAGLSLNREIWQVQDSLTLLCITDSFTDAGTGTAFLTPQFIYTNSTALGYNAEPDDDNQIMLGDLFITEVKTTGSLTASGAVLGDGTNNTEIDSSGSVVFVGNAGLCYADMYVVDNTTPSVITTMGVAVQVTIYDTDGPFNSATPDHTNDHITIVKAGDYKINVSATVNSVAGSGSRFEMTVQKNDGAAALGGLHVDRHLDGGGVSSGSVSMTGIVTLALNDTVEIWIENETGTQNYVVEDSDINIIQVGG